MEKQQDRLKDPYNLIITGVGGQGNVLASRVLGNMLVRQGFQITIGETFGASQRGGSVMSHLRISKSKYWSPQIPKGNADMIIALEPIEAIRLLATYGHENVNVLSNTRAIHPMAVIAGNETYPDISDIKASVADMSRNAWFINATDEALKMGNAIYSNIIILGALAHTKELPLYRDDFEAVIKENIGENQLTINLKAYDLGGELLTVDS